MDFLGLINKFNYNNIVVLDNENKFDLRIKDVIDNSLPIYSNLMEKYGNDIFESKINECDPNLYNEISSYISDNPYDAIDKVKEFINFNYFSSIIEFKKDCLIDGNTLWFVDISMGNYPIDYEHIKVLYKIFYERNKNENKNDIFILFSSLANNYKSLDKLDCFLKDEVKLSIDDSCVELNINIIEKEPFDAQLIYSLIMKSSKSKYFELLNKAIDISVSKFKQNIYDSSNNFDLFHYDYLTEGKCFDNLLYDIFNVELKKNYVENLDYSMFLIMNKAIDYLLEEESNVKSRKVLWRVAKVINDFDYPINIDSYINPMRHDISFGDVFILGKKYYMVGNQQCDVTIREDGNRKDMYAILIPLDFEKLSEYKIIDFKTDIASSILDKENKSCLFENDVFENIKAEIMDKYNIQYKKEEDRKIKSYDVIVKYNDAHYNVKFSSSRTAISFPFWCLDNVVCNDNGEVNFEYNSNGLRFPLKKRIIVAHEEYDKVKKDIDILTIESFLSVAYYSGKKLNVIKRIGKIENDVANSFYKDYLSYQSRVASDKIPKLK